MSRWSRFRQPNWIRMVDYTLVLILVAIFFFFWRFR